MLRQGWLYGLYILVSTQCSVPSHLSALVRVHLQILALAGTFWHAKLPLLAHYHAGAARSHLRQKSSLFSSSCTLKSV